ncbi:MAG: glycosyltransferase family 39 protein [Elusimicrobiota bacterium]|nr:glycosyltransferase family 39 protein [Elusimicrobiota bacterium]
MGMLGWPLGSALALAASAAALNVLRWEGGWLIFILSVTTAALIRLRPAGGFLRRFSDGFLLGSILVFALVARLAWIFSVANDPISDFAVYRELAQSLASGQGYSLTGPAGREEALLYLHRDMPFPYVTAWRAPGTALWGALLWTVFGGAVVVFQVANALLAAATAGLLYILGSREGDSRQGLIAAFLWAVYPAGVFASSLYGSETLFAFLLAACACCLSGRTGEFRFKPLAAGLVAAAACLTRSMAPALLVGAGAALLHGDRRKAAPRLGLFLAGLLLGVAPWTVRNYAAFERFIPIATGGGSFAARHSALLLPPEALQTPDFLERWERWRAAAGEVELGKAGYRAARENLADVLRRGPRYVLGALAGSLSISFAADDDLLLWSIKKTYGALVAPGPETALSADWTQRWMILGQTFYLGLLLAGLWGLFGARDKRGGALEGSRFLGGYFLTAFALHVVFPGPNRYHMSMMLLPALLAGRRAFAASADR